MKLTPRFTLVFSLYAIILLSAVGPLVYYSGRNALRSATLAELSATSIEKQAALNEWVHEKETDIAVLAADPTTIEEAAALVDATPLSPEASVAHNRLIEEIQPRVHSGEFLSVILIDPQTGEVIAATDPSEEGKFKEDRLFFLKGKIKPYVQNVYFSVSFQVPAMTASAPLKRSDGQLLGVLAGRINLEEMNSIVNRRSGLRKTDDAFLVNTSNLFVTQPYLVSDPAVLQRGVHTEAVNRCLRKTSGTVEVDDYRGVPAIIAYRWMPERELCLIVKMDQAEALAPVHAFGRTILWIALLTFIVAAALAFALSRSMIRPILAMQTAAQGYGHGRLDLRLPETRKDELGILAHEFNQMAAALAEKELELHLYTQTLEQKVQERTTELQKSHSQLSRAEQVGQIGSWEWLIAENTMIWTDGLYKLFGLVPQEFGATYEAYLERVHPDDCEYVQKVISDTFQAGGAFEFESRIFRKNGECRYLQTRGEMRLSAPDKPARMTGMAIDITERRQAEEALRESERRLKRAQEIAHLGSWELDLVNNQLTWSDEVYRIFGLQPQEFGATYEAFLEAVHPEDRAAVDTAYSGSVQAGRDSYEIEHRIVQRSTAEIRIVHEKCEHFRNQDGQIIHSIGMVHDITERKRAEEKLRRSEAMLRAVLDQMPSGVTVRDANIGTLILSNARGQEIMGTLVDSTNQFAQYRGFHPDGRPYQTGDWPLTRSMATGEVVQAEEVVYERSDDVRITLSINSAPVRDSQGQITMAVAVFDNITERKRAERALLDSEEKYRLLAENSNDWIYWIKPDQTFQYVSPACERVTGFSSSEFMEHVRLFIDIIHPEDRERVETHLREVREGDETHNLDYRILTKTNEIRWISHSCDPVYTPDGKYIGRNGTNRDVTERKRAEHALQSLTEDLQRSNAELEQFAYVASHDLQEPLRMVSSYMQLLKKRYQGKLDSDADEFIHYAVDGSTRMQTLINDLLAFSRVGTRGRPMGLSSCEKALNEALMNLQVAIDESDATITHDPLPTVFCDQPQLVQVFQNLIGNAIKFRAQQAPQIHVTASQQANEWLFSVCDNGIGLDPKFRERIFEIFQRLHGRTAYPGTGIGLAISKRIIQRHGGRIWVESQPGEGATFYFTLPIKETI